ncbi:MAG: tRNA (N6-threonylcarbamoyladenosine(37)-N6)-methyltransferase TrmO [Desulfuromonas sp.]|nr:MAG: tRNA (N6-threonylcarbamoyladenosine(37)-N6)-methyltransferase TrmO [Desulfuromonas sp.]
MECTPIGTIHTPFTDLEGMPIQPAGASEVQGTVVVNGEFAAGLKDLEGFSHLILIYQFHRSEGYKLEVTPFMDKVPRGLLATRAPKRPNPIGLSVVHLERVEGNILHIKGIDVLDGTPLLDIKPYVPQFDSRGEVRTGWFEKSDSDVTRHTSDKRFT